MTDEQKQQIIALRRDGAGYGRIAARLQTPVRLAGRNSPSTATAIGSSAPMPATLHTGSEVFAMDKRSFQNETAFQVVMHLARRMLAEKLITGKEYRDFVQEMIRRYQPFFGDLYT